MQVVINIVYKYRIKTISSFFILQVEVIGGADMYLSTCRACHKSPAKVKPLCSPRNKVSRTVTDHGNAQKRLFAPVQDENRMDMI